MSFCLVYSFAVPSAYPMVLPPFHVVFLTAISRPASVFSCRYNSLFSRICQPFVIKLQVYRHLLAHTCTLLYPWNLYTARNMIKIRQDASLARLAGYFVINESIKRLRRFIQTSAAFLSFHLILNCCNICFSRRITPYLPAHDNSGFTSQTPPRNPS